jgi:hypothetical protein
MASEDDPEPPAGTQRWLVSCDESGIDGKRFYAFGCLWFAWERRGDFTTRFGDLVRHHGFLGEAKWNKVSHRNIEFFKDLVDWFFSTPG